MSAEPGWAPIEDAPWPVRTIWRVVGEERMKRWVLRMEEKHPALAPLTDENRCPWVASWSGLRCTERRGHRGTCRTERVITNVQTGKSFVEPDYWRGINYDVNG